MSEKFSLTQADFAARFCRFTTPEAIPLTYKIGDTVYRGIPAGFSPVVKTEKNPKSDKIRRTVIEGTSPEGLTVRVEYEEYEDYPVTEWLAFFTNSTKAALPALSEIHFFASALNLPHGGGRPSLVRGTGEALDNCYTQYTERVNHDILFKNVNDISCAGNAFPYSRLICGGEKGNPTDEQLCVNIAIGWPGGWCSSYIPNELGGIDMKFGFPRFHVALRPGEVARSVRMTYMTTLGDEIRSINTWRRWWFDYIMPREADGSRFGPKMILLNENRQPGDCEFEGATEESQFTAYNAYKAHGLTPDVWWIDAGWFKGHFWRNAGSWDPNPDNFPNGLEPISKMCHDGGTRFLLWFQFENVRNGSDIDHEQPGRLTARYNVEKGCMAPEKLFYLGDRDNLEWMINYMDARVKKFGLDFYRIDMCFDPFFFFPALENGDGDRVGAPENFHMQGVLTFLDELCRRNPGLFIDNCACGGSRNDLEMMRRAIVFHYTDWGYGDHPMKQRQFSTYFRWIPYFRAHTTSWDDENGNYPVSRKVAVPHPKADRFVYQNTITPAIQPAIPYDSDEETYAFTREMVTIWRGYAELLLRGDYYPLTECERDSTMWYAVEFYDEKAGDGFVQFIRNVKCENDTFTACPHVEDGATYTLTDRETGESFVKSAAELEAGLTVTLPPRSGVIYYMKKN